MISQKPFYFPQIWIQRKILHENQLLNVPDTATFEILLHCVIHCYKGAYQVFSFFKGFISRLLKEISKFRTFYKIWGKVVWGQYSKTFLGIARKPYRVRQSKCNLFKRPYIQFGKRFLFIPKYKMCDINQRLRIYLLWLGMTHFCLDYGLGTSERAASFGRERTVSKYRIFRRKTFSNRAICKLSKR